MAKPSTKPGPSVDGATVCEPGRHVDCVHTRMAEKRAASKAGGKAGRQG